jgi:hypothetical protein
MRPVTQTHVSEVVKGTGVPDFRSCEPHKGSNRGRVLLSLVARIGVRRGEAHMLLQNWVTSISHEAVSTPAAAKHRPLCSPSGFTIGQDVSCCTQILLQGWAKITQNIVVKLFKSTLKNLYRISFTELDCILRTLSRIGYGDLSRKVSQCKNNKKVLARNGEIHRAKSFRFRYVPSILFNFHSASHH